MALAVAQLRAYFLFNSGGDWVLLGSQDSRASLLKMIEEDNENGRRVMSKDEMALLRQWKLGRNALAFSSRSSGIL